MTSRAQALRTALSGALIGLVILVSSCTSSEAEGEVEVVPAREAVTLIESGAYEVVDLRSTEAFEAGHVKGAQSLPYLKGTFKERLSELDPAAKYLLYSRDPAVARQAADALVALGFTHVVDAGAFGMLALAGAELVD
jgi:phage shock protein E